MADKNYLEEDHSMVSADIANMARKIRRDGSLRSFVGLLFLWGLLYARNEGAASATIIAVLAVYLIVTSTWAYVTAGRILHDFCDRSAEEVEGLKAELRELRDMIEAAKDSR